MEPYAVACSAGGRPADVAANAADIMACVARARNAGARLLVLPELCLTGAATGDLYRSTLLIRSAEAAAEDIALAAGDMACVLGMPLLRDGVLYNAAAVALGGKIVAYALKDRLTPAERRWFAPGGDACCARFALPGGEVAAALFLCDAAALMGADADILAILSAQPASAGAAARRRLAFAKLSSTPSRVALYANASLHESTTDMVFDGHALIARHGGIIAEVPPFARDAWALCARDDAAVAPPEALPEMDPVAPYMPLPGAARDGWCRETMEIAAHGLAARMVRAGCSTLTLGVSGGLDSAHAFLLSLRALEINALPADRLIAASLPGFGSSDRTRSNARRLIEAAGLPYREIDITSSVSLHFSDIGHSGTAHDAAYENAQARERTQVLMDLANMYNGLMVGPGDMSELALGFTTYGGDHMSMYGVNAGFFKSLIRANLEYAARACDNGATADVLRDILATPVSPELLPPEKGDIAQRTEEIVGPYRLNDFYLHHLLADAPGPDILLARAQAAFGGEYSTEELLQRMRGLYKRFFASQFKRSCLPDGPRVLDVSLSPRGGLMMPSDASAALWLGEIDRLIALQERTDTV